MGNHHNFIHVPWISTFPSYRYLAVKCVPTSEQEMAEIGFDRPLIQYLSFDWCRRLLQTIQGVPSTRESGLGWLRFGCSSSCPSYQPLLANSHHLGHNMAGSGTFKIQVNLTQYTSWWDTCRWRTQLCRSSTQSVCPSNANLPPGKQIPVLNSPRSPVAFLVYDLTIAHH